jgi:CheY-like chemotaxis protein/HPt (histidine-containing phosphotransfer) domain-containing protein
MRPHRANHARHQALRMSNRSLPSQLLNMLAPDIRSSLGELQGTLQLVAHDLAAKQDHDSVSQRRMELVKNANNRVSEFTNMLSIVTKLDALSQGDLKQQPERVDLLRLFDQLAELMNGSLRVTSVRNQGSEFILTLPLTVAAKPVHSRETAPPELINSRRILVAEDSKPNQLVVQTMLERQGYVVDVANDGIEACAAVKGNAPEDTPYCLILMDVQMPGMDGIEATRWIRNNGYSLPIVALTAKAFMEDEKACLEAGMNDFMTKPVNYEALLARVDMWLGDKSTQPSTLPGEKVSEMRVLMGEEAFKDALGVLSQEVSERHVTLHKILAEGDYAKASAELHTLFGIYAGYGFEELQHLARALQDSCDAKLAPPAKSLQHFDELSSELLHKIKRYRAETMA